MDLSQLIVFVLFLASTMCRGEIITKTSKWEQSMMRVADVLVNVMTSCHKSRVNGVGLAGNLPSSLYRTLTVQHSIPIALIENFYEFNYRDKTVPNQFRQPLNVFIIEAGDGEELNTLIQTNIREFRFWNSEASYFILDLSHGCANLRRFLNYAWAFDLLHAKVLCRNHRSGRIMFSYNPFTNKAPVSWQIETTSENRPNSFTVFSREFRENETIICEDLIFDKMGDLGGYSIKIKGYPDDYTKKTSATQGRGAYEFETRRRSILGTLFRRLNANVHFVDPATGRYEVITAEPEGLQYSLVKNLQLTYPHRQFEASIITQFRGHKTQLAKILSIIDEDSYYGMAVVYLITIIFLKIFVRQAVVPALLNLVRMTCNTAFVNLPDNTASRIYLGGLLFFVVTMQGIFQGDLAARLTKYMPLRNVDSIWDLQEFGYTNIYGKEYYRKVFDGLEVQKKFIVNNNESDCIMRVKNDLHSAYVGRAESFIIDMAESFNLHISRKPIEMIYVGFRVYNDWAMTKRVNVMISRIVEANALEVWEVKCRPLDLSDFYEDPAVKGNVDFKHLELYELSFAFAILGIGLAFATVVLMIEFSMGYETTYEIMIWRYDNTWEKRVEI